MAKKKKPNIIKVSKDPREFVYDNALQGQIITHVKQFGFHYVMGNIVEAYREQARMFNKQADELEKRSGE